MVGRRTLNPVVKVRVLVPQPYESPADAGLSSSKEATDERGGNGRGNDAVMVACCLAALGGGAHENALWSLREMLAGEVKRPRIAQG
jgi:hypothetical protein